MVKKRSFLRNASLVTVSLIGTTLTMLVTSVLTARYLGAAGKGQVALAMGAGMILSQLLCFGFDRSAPYYIASGMTSRDRVLGAWLITWLLGTLLTFGVCYPLFDRFLLSNVFANIDYRLLWVAGLFCPLYMGRLLLNSIMQGCEEFQRQTIHNISMFVATVIAATTSLSLLRWGPLGYIGFYLATGCFSLAVGVWILSRIMPLRPRLQWQVWWGMIRYGSKAMLGQLFTLIDLRIDIFIVNLFANAAAVGIYTIAVALGQMFWVLSNSLAAVLFPRTAFQKEGSRKLTALLCRNVLWLTFIAAVSFSVVCRPLIILVFGEEFSGASVAFLFLIPGLVGQAVSRICFTDCSARGYPGKATIASAITASLTLCFDLLLIPRWGMYGAAIASSVAYCTGGILGLYWHRKLSGNTLSELIWIHRQDWPHYRSLIVKMWKLIGAYRIRRNLS